MSKSLFLLSLCMLLFSHALPAFADGYDDCLNDCNQNVAPCVDQARLNAGNVQEEQDMIAACEKTKSNCIQVCRDAEAGTQAPPQQQQAPPPQEQQVPPPQEQQAPDTLNGTIKMYEFGK